MSCDKSDLVLYAVTDRSWLGTRSLSHDVELALMGGTTMLQLREKELCFDDFLAVAVEISALCKRYNVPFIINDNVEVAIACDGDGVHVGQSDMAVQNARQRMGAGKIIGVSVQTVEQAQLAQEQGADYLGVGAVFSTATKEDADDVSLETLRAICDAVSIPVVAIGGICAHNIEKLEGSGVAGVALVSALFAEKDIKAATKTMLRLATAVAEPKK